jgi:DNA-binding CsgD family transcriptional regulator
VSRRAEGSVRVAVVGADPEWRRRLTELLEGDPGVEVVERGDACAACAAADRGVVVQQVGVRAVPALSPRQLEVLAAYAAGNDLLPVVARGLGMNEETVKTHLRRIRAKYRAVGRPAPTRRDLYVRAVEDGLLRPPS